MLIILNSPHASLCALLGKLHPKNQVTKPIAVHALARTRCIGAVCIRHKRKAFRTASFSIFRKEDTSDSAKALEHLPQIGFLRELRDLNALVEAHLFGSGGKLTLVTLRVARSSLSPYLPPIFSPAPPAAPLPRRCGGT